MNYADEEYYKNEYLLGKESVVNAAFDFYARAATVEIKRFTGRNVDEGNIPDCVKNCCCELAELVYIHEKSAAESNGKSSESVGGWSVSYESKEQAQTNYNNSVCEIVYKWLSGTGLLFSGVRRC